MYKIRENGPVHWAVRAAGLAFLVVMVLWIPTWGYKNIGLVNDSLIIVLAAMSLNLLFGYTGQISIGHSAFFGIGSYTTAILVKKYDWSPGWTFYVGAIIAFVVGAAAAMPALRIKGIYLALVTLSMAFLFPKIVGWKKLEWLTKGQPGYDGVRYAHEKGQQLPNWPLVGPFPLKPPADCAGLPAPKPARCSVDPAQSRAEFHFWLTILVVVVAYLIIRGIVRSRVGRSLIAIRDNETAAAVMGIDLAATKTLVFGFSAGLCALAGSLAALRSTTVTPESPNIQVFGSIVFFIAVIIGGTATMWGPVLGGFLYFLGRDIMDDFTEKQPFKWLFGWSEANPAGMVFALILIAMMFVAPQGLLGLIKRLTRKIVVVVPRPFASTGAMNPGMHDPVLAVNTEQGEDS